MVLFYWRRSAEGSWVRPLLLQAPVITDRREPVTLFPLGPLVVDVDIWKNAEETGPGCAATLSGWRFLPKVKAKNNTKSLLKYNCLP